MKKNFIYFLPILLAFATGCLKTSESTPLPTPSGTFSGQVRVLHRKVGATKIDTVKANISLVLENGTTFKVLGDTAVVHAGSKGKFGISGGYAAFQDETYPKTGTPVKVHLNGYYQYFYDGASIFQMVANSADTLAYQYDLKKTN
jgi:hypothetical protein